jgi:glycine/D-amino acid oxidase-like deaminating enzyme
MKEVDLLIVGQGIAGINLSFLAKEKGLKCIHFHMPMLGEATKVAAGLINPITGRRFVKSWNIDAILPYAVRHYEKMEKDFGEIFLDRINILRTFKTVADENAWLAKSADPFLAEFLLEKLAFNKEAYAQKLKMPKLMGELKDCLRVRLTSIQEYYLKKLKEDGSLIEEKFDQKEITFDGSHILYRDIKAKNIIFAEGWRSMYNPLWEEIPFAPAKGELFIISAPNLKLNSAFKNTMFITPLGDDNYWTGATYEWQNYDPSPTEKMESRLLEMLENTLLSPYEIVAHLTGIRPSSKDRRPIIGPHKAHKNVFLFNGMGTKGSSLSPYYADKLLENIISQAEIPHNVSINRYYS